MITKEEEVQKINLCDPGAIKRVIDDTITKYMLEDLGYIEQTSLANVKLFLGIISVSLALTAQFYPAPFPENLHVLLICCPIYFVLSGILQYMASYMERNFMLFALTKDRFNPMEIQIFTKFPKYSYDFTIGISKNGTPDDKAITITKSVGKWFDKTGFFHIKEFLDDFKALLHQFNNKSKGD